MPKIKQMSALLIGLMLMTSANTQAAMPVAKSVARKIASEPIKSQLVPPPIHKSFVPEAKNTKYDNRDLLALVCMAEAEGESELGKRLVIDTVLNRVDDPDFPDNVTDVVYQTGQFSSMWSGRAKRCHPDEYYIYLVEQEIAYRTNHNCIYFTAGAYSSYGMPMFSEGGHYFSSK